MKLRPDAGPKLEGMVYGLLIAVMILAWLHQAGLVEFG